MQDKRLRLRISEVDKAIIKQASDLLGVSVSDFVRTAALERAMNDFKLIQKCPTEGMAGR